MEQLLRNVFWFCRLALVGTATLWCPCAFDQDMGDFRTLSGVIVTLKNEVVEGVTIAVESAHLGEARATSGPDGRFSLKVPKEALSVKIEGKNLAPQRLTIESAENSEDLSIQIEFVIPRIHNSLVIEASALDPGIDRRNATVYRETLFSRDDQVFHTLDAGIDAGQHEGGGKSVEVRRFGFNMDHGGVNGGLKVLVDDVQQNQGTQGHGQGYLGQLKSLTPELIQEVSILNGPFSAEYGDFSGLGVVHIRQRESLPDLVTARLQGGSFNSVRTFLAVSPRFKNIESFAAYEGSYTDGPFINPLHYRRDNLTSNFTTYLDERQSLGLRLNFGRNDFDSSGQIPLDQVGAGKLDPFGFVDPSDGGKVKSGVLAAYYRREWALGDTLKIDGFLSRSLFDLYSNFTFYLMDPVNGDAFQQHDSRLQEGTNAQFIHPFKLFGRQSLLTAGTNLHDNQINVGLYPQIDRRPLGVTTRSHAHVTNVAGYVQQGIDLLQGRVHIEGGLRYDYFRFGLTDEVRPENSGVQGAARIQPKAGVAITPSRHIPLTVHFNYGRGISSQDARGVVERPSSPRISTTDFYQIGTSHHLRRLSFSTDLFLIDRSNEQVYVPDDGSLEFKGPSRSYGYEAKMSIDITRGMSLNGGLTKVTNAFYRGTLPRVYVDSAPHAVANAGLNLSGWHGFHSALRWRYINGYRLDGTNAGIRATGHSVLDLSTTRRVRKSVDFNLAIDNLTNELYNETQNYFESRLRPEDPVVARIHGTPGYPIGVTVGLTFHLSGK
jgi:hypothetical protein